MKIPQQAQEEREKASCCYTKEGRRPCYLPLNCLLQ